MSQQLYILGLMSLLCVFACRETKEMMPKKEANAFFMQNTDTITWKLEKSFDPYNGGITTQAAKDNTPYWEFYADGTFLEYNGMQKSRGNWYVNKDKSALGFVYTLQNDKPLKVKQNLTTEGFPYKIKFLDKQKMVLARQGRHGFVENTYMSVKMGNEK